MRVMNVKFVGRIIMTVLFVFICIGAHAGDDPLKYEIEGEGVGAQGIYMGHRTKRILRIERKEYQTY